MRRICLPHTLKSSTGVLLQRRCGIVVCGSDIRMRGRPAATTATGRKGLVE